jgi:hypothetical protein
MEERNGLQREADQVKDRLKSAQEQLLKNAQIIATLEDKLGIARTPESPDVEGEDLSNEMNISRKDL